MRIKKLYSFAEKRNIAIGHFNVSNVETFEAAVVASRKTKRPIFLAVSEGAIRHSGLEFFVGAREYYSKKYKIELFLHLDHGMDLDIIGDAIHQGFDSVMIDGSHYEFESNIRITRSVVNQAHRYGVFVEAELGTIGGAEENARAKKIIYTDPLQAQEFVARTNCDALAVAIGTSHGIYKFLKKSAINFQLLDVLKNIIPVPLVLHGASMIDPKIVKSLQKWRVKIGHAVGVSESDLKKAIKYGIRKVNVDTDLQLVMLTEIERQIHRPHPELKLYKILGEAGRVMEEEVIKHIKLFSSH